MVTCFCPRQGNDSFHAKTRNYPPLGNPSELLGTKGYVELSTCQEVFKLFVLLRWELVACFMLTAFGAGVLWLGTA
jgi:hypothetical protein